MIVTNTLKYNGLPLGGHACVITSAEDMESRNGNQMIKICFDIIEDSEFNHYLQKLSDSINYNRDYYNWPNEGTKYFVSDGIGAKYFNQFISQLERVNNIKFDMPAVGEDFDVSQFIGLKIGCEFGLEEYEKNGKIKTALSILGFRTLDQLPFIRNYHVKRLDGKIVDYDLYIKERENDSCDE